MGAFCPRRYEQLEGVEAVITGANGEIVPGSRVQTQYTVEEGGDGRWYQGTVKRVYREGTVYIKYDDGDEWTGSAMHVWLVDGPAPAEVASGVVAAPLRLRDDQIPDSEPVADGAPACPVCMTNVMNMALGCGHRVCGDCLKAIRRRQQEQCPVCRTPITSCVRLYN
eukprot:TRINITY_DN44579_c0_g1_i2.p1 TRINITY_DN44579_c0_g1~~TRINITY_DN44579_c0_g1_i2.p1  ORF type:complete len:167 (+),score=15.80 TRINITY_DN44579_c0_g1_i2:116-616(+)